MNKSKKCVKGFPCGYACISRTKQCWANLSSSEGGMAETFSQFVNRLVGIGNDKESSLGNNILDVIKDEEKELEEFTKVYVREDLEDIESNIIKNVGIDIYKKAKENLKEIIKGRSININFPSKFLELLLDSGGRFKNQWETGTTYGSDDLDWRAEGEELALGVDINLPPQEKPVYGHLPKNEINDSRYEANIYGDIRFELKENVKNKATFTLGDSAMEEGKSIASKFDDPKPLHKRKDVLLGLSKMVDLENFAVNELYKLMLSYIEVQMYGGVSLRDVKVAYIPKDFINSNQDLINRLKSQNIEIKVT